MNREQLKYQKNRLLRAVLAILLLFTVSFSYTYADTVRQTVQSEAFYSKNNTSERKIISYKKAIRFSVLDVKSEKSSISIDFSAVHTLQAKVKATQKHKEYCSFKSNVQFFRAKTTPVHAEDIPVS